MPDSVASEPVKVVAAVLAEVPAQGTAIVRSVGLGNPQQRAKQAQICLGPRPGPLRQEFHSPESVQPGPPQNVEQHGLGLVVGRMAGSNGSGAEFFGYLGQERIPHLPRGLLEGGDAPLPLVFNGVLLVYRARQTQVMGHRLNKPGVLVGLFAPKIVVQVGDVELQAMLLHQPVQAEK